MASVNKASLRAEFDAMRARFASLCADGKAGEEVRALVEALLMLMELMMAVFMEKNTRRNARNSGLPGSLAGPDDGSARRPGSKGRGPKTSPGADGPVRAVREERSAPVSECRACGRCLAGGAPEGHERRVLVDIVFETTETTVEAEIKTCPRCRTENRGRFPDNMPGPLQYGHGVVAFAAHQMCAQMVPLKRTGETLRALTGRAVSESTLLGWLARLHDSLADWEAAARERLLSMPALHADETGLRVDGRNHWIHSVGAGDLTLKFVHPKRGREAMGEINIIPRYRGVLVHDRWASYHAYGNCEHALCGAHLLRDLQFVEDAHGHAWPRRMRSLLTDTCRSVREHPDSALPEADFRQLRRRYRTILTQGKRELPKAPPRITGKRGRVARSDAENLHAALSEHEDMVLRFAQDPNVPFTNNRAERDIRMAKVKQKISGCFRTQQFASVYCRVSSYLQSMALQGYNPLAAIQIALNGNAANIFDNPPQAP